MKTSKTMSASVTLIIIGESGREEWEIVAFSMREPSATHCRFITKDGQTLESHGCNLHYRGDIDALPSAMTATQR